MFPGALSSRNFDIGLLCINRNLKAWSMAVIKMITNWIGNVRLILMLSGILMSGAAAASDGDVTQYVNISTGMVLNYGEPSLNRLKYIKIALNARVANAEAAEIIEYHMPAIKDRLVTIFTSQDEETIRSPDGKEQIRQSALAELQKLIEEEHGEPVIDDLLFGRFVVQR
jgi:flagellar FliL protein